VLVEDLVDAGYWTMVQDGSEFASGIYFSRLKVGEFVATKRMLLLK